MFLIEMKGMLPQKELINTLLCNDVRVSRSTRALWLLMVVWGVCQVLAFVVLGGLHGPRRRVHDNSQTNGHYQKMRTLPCKPSTVVYLQQHDGTNTAFGSLERVKC